MIKNNQLPKKVVWAVIAICALPFFLNLLGVDFDSTQQPFDVSIFSEMSKYQKLDALYHSLSGSFIHTILEWSAFFTAIFTALLSFVYFQIKGDIVTPILGIALFFAGSMDAFELQPGDGVVLYTDGIPEAKDINKKQYGLEPMCEVISKNWHL